MVSWSYLENRKQFTPHENVLTSGIKISCGARQGSIFGPLLFLVYVNDLNKASDVLDTIMFDTNYSHQNKKTLFATVNSEFQMICGWFRANKFSLNVTKTNYTLFHKNSAKDKLPLKMPQLIIGSIKIKNKSSVKFLGVMLDENISWKVPIKTIESAKPLSWWKVLKNHIFSYIYSFLSYVNIDWASTRITKLTL